MASDYDPTEFVDGDLQAAKPIAAAGPASSLSLRAAAMEREDELAEKQQRLAQLKREQEALERERASLEETRRRQAEYQTGRQEIVQQLTRGVGLLQEAEFSTRRDAEQMAKALVGLREALDKVEAIHDETWSGGDYEKELTRALTTIENARMEWNSARLKFTVLDKALQAAPAEPAHPEAAPISPLTTKNFSDLCRMGLALTWPVAVAVLIGIALLAVVLFRR
jgi:DNA repair exonuclease SbcCD ATPase subunit